MVYKDAIGQLAIKVTRFCLLLISGHFSKTCSEGRDGCSYIRL